MQIFEVKNHIPVITWMGMESPDEWETVERTKQVALLPWAFHHVALMSDGHIGRGATVGSVIAMKNAISPAAVGADIGCVDKDTEYLSRTGWKKISLFNYDDEVMQYDPNTKEGQFVKPTHYHKKVMKLTEKFYHFHTKYGIDQMLSEEHKVLYITESGKENTISAKELYENHTKTVLGFRGKFWTTFELNQDPLTKLSLSDEIIRVMVMVCADGSYISKGNSSLVQLRLKKERKIIRAKELLIAANISFEESIDSDEVTEIRFYAPFKSKTFDWAWCANKEQLKIFTTESWHWDGNLEDRVFFSRIKENADFMQYAYTVAGWRAVLLTDDRESGIDYRVFANSNITVGLAGTPKTPIDIVESIDGYKYCFTVPSGFWVMRRNGKICITGNCGMAAIKLSLTANDLPDSLHELRSLIEERIPVGFNSHVSVKKLTDSLDDKGLWGMFEKLDSRVHKLVSKARHQCGTLGGGNHFFELCLDTQNSVWLMLHSGSRNIGKELADIHIAAAKNLVHNKGISDPDLAVVLYQSPEWEAYVNDLHWAQEYAFLNRKVMIELGFGAIAHYFSEQGKIVEKGETILCHHNYAALETHFGEKVYVTRKGAINAEKGRMGIIPGSMGTKSFIVRGLGNPDSFNSASHGAGRRMSRGKAKKSFSIEDLATQTAGVECRKDKGVLDEIPGAYKNIEDIIALQTDLVEIVAELKQVICIKG